MSFLHFGLSPADLFAPIHVSPISCRSSLNVVCQVFIGLPGLRLPLSGCQFTAMYAGPFSDRRKIWPANLGLLCHTISDKFPKSVLRKTSSLVMWSRHDIPKNIVFSVLKIQWWEVGIIICLEQGEDCLNVVWLLLLPFQYHVLLWRRWLGGRKGIQPVKTEQWGAGMVICLERGADLHMAVNWVFVYLLDFMVHSLQCFDAVGWAAGRASGL